MSTATAVPTRYTGTSGGSDTADTYVLASQPLIVNRLIDALIDVDLYEDQEPKPSAEVILMAAAMVPHEYWFGAEIEPYFGEINVTWRSAFIATSRRVKAIFGPEANSFSVYHERMADGRIIEHHLEPHSTTNYLRDRIAWLHAEH